MGASTEFVVLRDGPIVPVAPYLLLLDLERRGFTLRVENTTVLVVTPPERLTDADCIAIRRWKAHLLMLIAYGQRDDIAAHLFDRVS